MGLIDAGVDARVAVHDAKDFGVAQSRKRVFLTFVRNDLPMPSMPQPTHGIENNPVATVGDALVGLPKTSCGHSRNSAGITSVGL